MIAYGTASKVGMLVGALVCVLLVFASKLFFYSSEIEEVGWIVYQFRRLPRLTYGSGVAECGF